MPLKLPELPPLQNVTTRLGTKKPEGYPEKLSMKVPRSAADYIQTAAEDRLHVVTKIRCVGVWDTVGSYGIPAGIGLAALSRIFTAWLLRGFHDTEIGTCIEIGLHAVAVDERRRPFAPTFWTIPRGKHPAGDVEQVWFVGAHTNIGGGYLDARLSDIPLIWMMARVSEIGDSKFGGSLEFNTQFIQLRTTPSPFGALYRSEKWWPISSVFPYIRPVLAPRAIEVRAVLWNGEKPRDEHINEEIHWTVLSRLGRYAPVDGAAALYRPENLTQTPAPPHRVATNTPKEQEFGLISAAQDQAAAPMPAG